MNELALFAGVGGGILGGKLLGWRTVCAVERDAYASQVLAQRQNDGILEPFPIWSDITTFDGRPWRGIVDVVSGGFPCQDISAAGKGAGIEGARSGMWKEMARIIGEVRPTYAFIENSPMLTTRGLGTVLADLASMGFDAEWGVLSASDVGAPHLRERIWIVAKQRNFFSHTEHNGAGWRKQQQKGAEKESGTMSNARCEHGRESNATRMDANAQEWSASTIHNQSSSEGFIDVAYTMRNGQQGGWQDGATERQTGLCSGTRGDQEQNILGDTTGIYAQRQHRRPWQVEFGRASWWTVEPNVGRVANGLAARVDRLKAIGNGQVPLCAATAFELLRDRLNINPNLTKD